MTIPKRRPGKRPAPRTVEVTVARGEYEGWYAKAVADFSAGRLADLQSSDLARILPVLELIIVEHNMPDATGEIAEHLADVDPYDGLMVLAAEIFDAIGKLPNR